MNETPPHVDSKTRPEPSWRLKLLLILALLGTVAGVYETIHTLRIQKHGIVTDGPCAINEWIQCDVVALSSRALLFGVPAAWWGTMCYFVQALASGLVLWGKLDRRLFTAGNLGLSVMALAVSAHQAWFLFTELKLFCPICVGMYCLNVALAVLWLSETVSHHPLINSTTLNSAAIFLAAVACVMVLGGVSMRVLSKKYYGAAKLDAKSEVRRYFEQQPRVIASDPEAPIWGNSNAPVQIVMFSDFECPACRKVALTVKGRLWQYRNNIGLRFHYYPADPMVNIYTPKGRHLHGGLAAVAAVVAQNHGDFWGYHDDLFRKQNALSESMILDLATRHGWSRPEFASGLTNSANLAVVKRHIELGHQVGVTYTPTIFINRREIKLPPFSDPEIFNQILEQELASPTPMRAP